MRALFLVVAFFCCNVSAAVRELAPIQMPKMIIIDDKTAKKTKKNVAQIKTKQVSEIDVLLKTIPNFKNKFSFEKPH